MNVMKYQKKHVLNYSLNGKVGSAELFFVHLNFARFCDICVSQVALLEETKHQPFCRISVLIIYVLATKQKPVLRPLFAIRLCW